MSLYACIFLPFPPTTNNLFVNNPRSRGRFPSKSYKAWQEEAANALAGQGLLPRYECKVAVTLSLGRPDNRRRDIANYEKAAVDQIVKAGVLADDSIIERITIQWASDVTGCRIEIEDAA